MSSHLPLSASSEQKLLMILSALTQLLSLCLSDSKFWISSRCCTSFITPQHPHHLISPCVVSPLSLSLSVCLQTSSPAALRPPRALRQHLSPRCRRSASPRRWGSARWGRSPCPKTSSTNRPWRRRRGRTCPTRPTPRGSGAVRCTHFNFPHHTP